MSALVSDTWALTTRWLIHLRRDSMTLIMGLFQPLMWLFLFGGIFGNFASKSPNLKESFGNVDYLTFYTSGVLAFTTLTNAVLGGIPLVFDRENGFLDRVLSAPVSRLSIVLSRFIYVTLYSLFQTYVVLGVAFLLLGVRFDPAALVGIAVYSALLAAGLTALSLALAFYASHVAFFTLTGVFLTPILFLSSAFVPLDRLDGVWRVVALLNPLTHAIDPMRAQMVGGTANHALHATFLVGFDVACIVFSVAAIKKKLD